MIDSYTNTSQTVASEGLLSFATNDVLTGCTVTHGAGTTSFTLRKPGFYFISFTGTGSVSGATAGTITVNLLKNGNSVPGATATQSSASTTDFRTVNFSKIVQVLPSCCAINNITTLTFQNVGSEAIFTNANVVITKLAQEGFYD